MKTLKIQFFICIAALDESNWNTTVQHCFDKTSNKTVANTPSIYLSASMPININNNSTMTTIQIFKDNQTALECQPQPLLLAEGVSKCNDESSIFVYQSHLQDDKTKKAVESEPAVKRKPFGVLVDNEAAMEMEQNNYSSIQHTTTTDSPSLTTKIIEFEPPAASTRNIRPLLNKMGLNKFSNVTIEENLEDSELNSFLIEKKEANQNDQEKRLSNLLARDFPTSKWNVSGPQTPKVNTMEVVAQCVEIENNKTQTAVTKELPIAPVSEGKTTKQVKFHLDANNETTMTQRMRTSGGDTFSQTNLNGENISLDYDYDFMNIHNNREIVNQSNIKVLFF